MSKSAESVKNRTVFNNIGCLYLPVDDKEVVINWYEKHFNSGRTRDISVFWCKTTEKGLTCNFMTDQWIPGEQYEMFSVRFETDAIEELYERLSAAKVKLEPLEKVDDKGLMFVFTDPQGNKFQVWQHPDTVTQPLQDGVPALMGVAALFFPVSDREVTRKWYTEFVGVEMSESGHPITGKSQEFFFYRSLKPGHTLNYPATDKEIPDKSIVMVNVFGIDEMHRRMIDQGQRVQEQLLDREGCGIQFQLYDPDGNKLDIWDLQIIVERKPSKADEPNWKERFKFFNCCFNVGVDAFLEKVVEGADGSRHKRVQILDTAVIRESDPEGLKQLVAALEQFGEKYPEWAFEIVYREGPSSY